MKSIQEQLIEKGLAQLVTEAGKKNDAMTRRKSNERLSERELAELMGTGRDTYKRHRGSVRRR